jgi:hypothetical protein
LRATLETYASIVHEHRGHQLAALLHRGGHVGHAQEHLRSFVEKLITEAAAAGHVRSDIPAGELAGFCLHALGAAGSLRAKAAVRRLTEVTIGAVVIGPAGTNQG